MPATMRQLRSLEMCTSEYGAILMFSAGPTSYVRIHCAELENGLRIFQQQIDEALYQCFKRIQHACVNDTLANEAVDLAKTAGNALVLCGVRKFQNTLGTLKGKKRFGEFGEHLGLCCFGVCCVSWRGLVGAPRRLAGFFPHRIANARSAGSARWAHGLPFA